jgi:FkbM family methyltransferase
MDADLDSRELADATVGAVPWYFRLGRYLARRHIRGGDRLLHEARRRGLLDRLAVYSFGNDVQLRVPLWRPCNQWDELDVLAYEAALVDVLGASIDRMTTPVTVVDCGADIGTVSVRLVARCRAIQRVIAFEPNRAAYGVLAQNIAALPVAAQPRNAAVGNFCGRGRLVSPEEDPSAHAKYVVPAADGDIVMQRIDDLDIAPGGGLVVKIDVEGGERAVVEGASRTLREAGQVVVAFEAHPRVARRTNQDPVEVMRALLSIRPDFTFQIDKLPACQVSPEAPLFAQVTDVGVYNVVARSGVS